MEPLSLLTALLGGLLPLVRIAVDAFRQRGKERVVARDALDFVLKSADLKTLGDYLDGQLGGIDVGRYARNEDARRRVDRVLARLEEFLGPEEPEIDESVAKTSEPSLGAYSRDGLPSDILERLSAGDEWGALVRLRIHLEQATRAALEAHQVAIGPRLPLTRALDRLRELGVLSADAIGSAHAARSVANRAAHGQLISADDIQFAIGAGAYALRELRRAAQGRAVL